MDLKKLMTWHDAHKCSSIHGRYVTAAAITPILSGLPDNFKVQNVGISFEGRTLKTVHVGTGEQKILFWSQMHGNESTGTKAILDLLIWLSQNTPEVESLLTACTLVFMPIVNPDGAEAYTRLNAQGIDLNRDVIAFEAPESSILQTVLKQVNPAFCFNLHDQRTIFSVGTGRHPATLSFLAPSVDEDRTVTKGRKQTMSVIATIHHEIKKVLPYQIGRYSDEFYPTATGDNFEKMGHHTILIEAGHYLNDYQREIVRKYNWLALVLGIKAIANPSQLNSYREYFEIPNNEQYYLDEIYQNVRLKDVGKLVDLGILYKEVLKEGQVCFEQQLEKSGDLSGYMANKQHNYKGQVFIDKEDFLKNVKK